MAFTMSAVGSNAAYSEAAALETNWAVLLTISWITGMIPPAASACGEATPAFTLALMASDIGRQFLPHASTGLDVVPEILDALYDAVDKKLESLAPVHIRDETERGFDVGRSPRPAVLRVAVAEVDSTRNAGSAGRRLIADQRNQLTGWTSGRSGGRDHIVILRLRAGRQLDGRVDLFLGEV